MTHDNLASTIAHLEPQGTAPTDSGMFLLTDEQNDTVSGGLLPAIVLGVVLAADVLLFAWGMSQGSGGSGGDGGVDGGG